MAGEDLDNSGLYERMAAEDGGYGGIIGPDLTDADPQPGKNRYNEEFAGGFNNFDQPDFAGNMMDKEQPADEDPKSEGNAGQNKESNEWQEDWDRSESNNQNGKKAGGENQGDNAKKDDKGQAGQDQKKDDKDKKNDKNKDKKDEQETKGGLKWRGGKVDLASLQHDWPLCKSANVGPLKRMAINAAVFGFLVKRDGAPPINFSLYSGLKFAIGNDIDLLGGMLELSESLGKKVAMTGVAAALFPLTGLASDVKNTATVNLVLEEVLSDTGIQEKLQDLFQNAQKKIK